jgi:hypothetical protein
MKKIKGMNKRDGKAYVVRKRGLGFKLVVEYGKHAE